MNLSRSELLAEIDEKTKDLDAFSRARDLVRARVLEVQDSACQLTPLPNWSGTDAVLGSLDLACHAIERTLEELRALLNKVDSERPSLRVIAGGDSDDEHA